MKKISIILAASILALSLTACNEKKTDTTESVTEDTTQTTEETTEETTEDTSEETTEETEEDIEDETEETEPLIPIPTADPSKEGQYAKPIMLHTSTVNYWLDSMVCEDKEYYEKKHENFTVSFVYHYFTVDEDTSFTTLKNIVNQEGQDDLDIGINNFNKYYVECLNEEHTDYFSTSNSQWYEVYRSDSKILSYYIQSSIHPDDQFRTYNYEPNSGKLITLKDTCTDYTKLYDALIEEADSHPDSYTFVEDYKDVIKQMFSDNEIEFVITYDGIMVMIPGQKISTVFYTNINFKISYQKYNDILVADYWTDLPCDLVIKFDDYMSDFDFVFYLDYDTNHDGTYEHYEVTDSLLTINDKKNKLESTDYHQACYLVIKNGRCFIYVSNDLDFRKSRLDIYEVIGNKATFFGSYEGDIKIFTHPSQINMQVNKPFIGKGTYLFEATVNDDFEIERTSDYYSYEQIDSIKTICDINGIDLSTNGSYVIPTDTKLVLTQTDFETYVDFKLQDDMTKTIRVEYEPNPDRLDGKEFKDCFTEYTLNYWNGF